MDNNFAPDSGKWIFLDNTKKWIEEDPDDYFWENVDSLNIIILAGFPRSGNTFLLYSLKEMYPDYTFVSHDHTTISIKKYSGVYPIISPIRNPIDSISSLNYFTKWMKEDFGAQKNISSIEEDTQYYIRYYKNLFEYKEHILFLDFEIFKNNLKYVSNEIKNKYSIDSYRITDVENVKEKMSKDDPNLKNLPNKNVLKIEELKSKVLENPNIKRAIYQYQLCLNSI